MIDLFVIHAYDVNVKTGTIEKVFEDIEVFCDKGRYCYHAVPSTLSPADWIAFSIPVVDIKVVKK